MTAGDVAEQFPEEQAALMAGEDIQRGIDGESLGQVAERARAAIDEMLPSLAPGECAVIATHGVSGRAIVASLVDLDQHQRLAVHRWAAQLPLGRAARICRRVADRGMERRPKTLVSIPIW